MPTPLRNSLTTTVAVAAAAAGGASGEPVQSVLHPAGPAAGSIAWLWWLLFWVCAAVFVVVLVMTALALAWPRRAEGARPLLGSKFIITSGIVLPSIILVGTLLYSLRTTIALQMPRETELTVRVTGYRWWWAVEYPDAGMTTANEIHIPVGKPVRIELLAQDVIHSFWVPRLNGKMDMIPGHENAFWIQADAPGQYRGQCAEYCGTQHALMALVVVALPHDEFERWMASRSTPPAPPAEGSPLRAGYDAFFTAGCNNCHAVAGTAAAARLGPDLTHIGSRTTLGAGTLPNTRGNLAGWIVNPQPIKPGNLMPPTYIQPADLQHLLDYLQSLK